MSNYSAYHPTKYQQPTYEYAYRPRDNYGDAFEVHHAKLTETPETVAKGVRDLIDEYGAATCDLWIQRTRTCKNRRTGEYEWVTDEEEVYASDGNILEPYYPETYPKKVRDHIAAVLQALNS